jgi:hypothetical protein
MNQTSGEFDITKGRDGSLTLHFDSDRASECCDFFIYNNLKKISLHYAFKDKDLSKLLPICKYVEGIYLSEKLEYLLLDNFINLKFLSVPDNKKDIIDVSIFPKLEELCCNLTIRLIGLENLKNLITLFINNYKSPSFNLSNLPQIDSLEYLAITLANIKDISGIERFKNLKKLKIYGASRLETISNIQLLSNRLIEIEIEKCKKITDYQILDKINTLQKLIISESGFIESLSFIKSLSNLEFFNFWGTNVLDGNLDYCIGIKYVGFDNKRHYNHKYEEFNK